MMKRLLTSMLTFSAMSASAVLLLVLQLSTTLVRADSQVNWYIQQLFEPTPAQLQQEVAGGRVQIYAGLTDTDVSRAMNEQFDRIEYMMFTGTLMTDASGAVLMDPETGEALVEDDGC